MSHWVDSDPPEVDDDGQRPCARGEHCAARTTVVEDGERITVPARTYREFCDADRDRIQACLNELPARHAGLRSRLGDKARADGPRVSGGAKAPPSLVNLGVDAYVRTIEEIILSWDDRVRPIARRSPLTAPTVSDAISPACRTLSAHVDVLLGLDADGMTRTMDLAHAEYLPGDASGWVFPYGEWILYYTNMGGRHAGFEVLNLHHRALRMLGLTPQHHDLYTPCWACSERKLRRHDGSAGLADHVECLHCREQYLGSRLSSLMVEEEQAQQRKRDKQARRAERARVLQGGIGGYGGRP